MRIGILTSQDVGVASYMLPHLQQLASGFEVVAVFYNSGQPAKNRRWAVRKAKKVLRIGLLGVLIGFRMRRWYGVNTSEILGVKSLGQLRENNGFYFDLFELPSLNGRRMVQAMKSARVDLVVSLGNGFISPSVYSIPKFWDVECSSRAIALSSKCPKCNLAVVRQEQYYGIYNSRNLKGNRWRANCLERGHSYCL